MKNILIPTDFTITSLKLINKAAARFADQRLNITLVHALEPDNSISGLLMLNKRLDVHALYTAEFLDACEVLRNKYASVVDKIKIEFYYGLTKQYRSNFLEARNIDAILFAEDYEPLKPSAASRDARLVWSGSGPAIFQEKIKATEKGQKVKETEHSISELLHA